MDAYWIIVQPATMNLGYGLEIYGDWFHAAEQMRRGGLIMVEADSDEQAVAWAAGFIDQVSQQGRYCQLVDVNGPRWN